MTKQSNYAFIDGQNLNLSIQSLGWKLDYTRFRQYLTDKYNVSKAYLFIGFMASNQELYTALQGYGFILVFKPTLEMTEGDIKGNVDAELVLHAMIEIKNYHQAVIVTGDGDFYCLVEYLNKQQKLAKLLIPNAKRYSQLLKPYAEDNIDFISHHRSQLEYRHRSRQPKKPTTEDGS